MKAAGVGADCMSGLRINRSQRDQKVRQHRKISTSPEAVTQLAATAAGLRLCPIRSKPLRCCMTCWPLCAMSQGMPLRLSTGRFRRPWDALPTVSKHVKPLHQALNWRTPRPSVIEPNTTSSHIPPLANKNQTSLSWGLSRTFVGLMSGGGCMAVVVLVLCFSISDRCERLRAA